MEAFDKVEELLLAEGYSKEEIPAIMVSLVEQGMSPAEIISRGMVGLANMGLSGLEGADRVLKSLPQKRKPEPLPKTKAVADLLPDTQQPKAPKPEFGSNAAKPQTRVKPELRPGGRTPEPQFRTNQPARNVNPARNNLSLQRTNLRAPSIPAPPVSKPSLFSRMRGAGASLAAQTAGIELATKLAQTAGTPGQSRMSMFGTSLRGNAPVYNTPLNPNNVPAPQPKSTRPKGMSNIPPAEGMVNNPNYGKPGTVQPKATPTPPTPSTPTPAPPVPKLTTAQQAVNTEYDKLRKSNPADAVKYGLKMARAGASKSSFTLPK